MGRQVNLDEPLSPEDRDYLLSRGRKNLVLVNERRFGTPDNPREPEAHEQAGGSALSPFYDNQERDRASYDVGGVALPGSVLDYDTGRVLDRDNGMTVEYTGPGHTPGAYPSSASYDEGFASYATDSNGNPIDDDFDQDIVDFVVNLPNRNSVITELEKYEESDFEKDDKRSDLNDALAIVLQDRRRAGKPIELPEEALEGDPDENEDSDSDEDEDPSGD